jgi:hypothetical protein
VLFKFANKADVINIKIFTKRGLEVKVEKNKKKLSKKDDSINIMMNIVVDVPKKLFPI